MEQLKFNGLLLKTAFSCMACDADIDKRELQLIKKLHKDKHVFGDIDINAKLDELIIEINKNGNQFLKDYLRDLKVSDLSENEELKLIEVAISTIKADEKVKYSELKFFKVIRSKLKIDNELILSKHPDFEDYLEENINTDSDLSKLQDDFFNTQLSKEFDLISRIDDDILDNLKDNNEV